MFKVEVNPEIIYDHVSGEFIRKFLATEERKKINMDNLVSFDSLEFKNANLDDLLEENNIYKLEVFLKINPECKTKDFFFNVCFNTHLKFKNLWFLQQIGNEINVSDYNNFEIMEFLNELITDNERLFVTQNCLAVFNEILLPEQRVSLLDEFLYLILGENILSTPNGQIVINCCQIILEESSFSVKNEYDFSRSRTKESIPVNSENGILLKLAIILNWPIYAEKLLSDPLIRLTCNIFQQNSYSMIFKCEEIRMAFVRDNLVIGKLIMKKLLQQNPNLKLTLLEPIITGDFLSTYDKIEFDEYLESFKRFLFLCTRD